jgi:V8-like Glu-specific endopeptidase
MMDLPGADRQRIVDLLARQAGESFVGPTAYFRDLVLRSSFPENWRLRLSGTWSGDPLIDARRLVEWCIAHDVNPADPRVTTLGSLVRALKDDVGLEASTTLTAVILTYGLYRDESLRAALIAGNQVPEAAPRTIPSDGLVPTPELVWSGTDDDVELQGLFAPAPELLDVGFLARAISRARAVCRVERRGGGPLGTGCLVGPSLLLTCWHVLANRPDEHPAQTASEIVVRFGCLTNAGAEEVAEQVVKPRGGDPVVASSPADELDFVLLELDDEMRGFKDVTPLSPSDGGVQRGDALNILQHPGGETMKLALSANGVAGVDPDRGFIQYVTSASGGSSGSPCFTDSWGVVALHRAERSRAFGSIREGVLLSAIQAKSGGAF